MKKKLLASIIQTPDGTIMHSKYLYDCINHKDKNGETYMLDGGTSHVRTSINKIKAKDLSVYDTDKIEKIRESFVWGSRGKSGLEYMVYNKLKDMSNIHIHAVLDTQLIISDGLKFVFQRELEFRKKNMFVLYENNILHKIDHRLKYLKSKGIEILISYGSSIRFTLKNEHVFTMTCSDKYDFNIVLNQALNGLIDTISNEILNDVIKTNKKTGKILKIKDHGKLRYKK